MSKYVKILKALSDEKRFKLFAVLLEAQGEFYVCEITDALGESQYNVSKYLKELKNAELVKERRIGKGVLYSVVDPQDTFLESLFIAVKSTEDEEFKKTVKFLKLRSSIREENKCITLNRDFLKKE